MGLSDVLEEVEILQSIFCQDGEFEMHTDVARLGDCKDPHVTYSIKINFDLEGVEDKCFLPLLTNGPNDKFLVVLTVTLDSKYPSEVNNISLKSNNFTKNQLMQMKAGLKKYSADIITKNQEPLMMHLTQWIKKNCVTFMEEDRTTKLPSGKKKNLSKSIVLKLDHMRARQKYCKLITKWMDEFNLSGRLLFQGKMIWIIVCGKLEDVNGYLKCHRTCNVDVDASGRPCKERMMDIYLEREYENTDESLTEFKVVECQSFDELKQEFLHFKINPEDIL